MSSISPTAKIYPHVRLGKDVQVGDWAVVGMPPAGTEPGELETIVGDGAVIRSHSVVYAGSRIGEGFQTGHRAVVGPAMQIGVGCSIGTGTVTEGFAQLDDSARVHSLCYLGPFARVFSKAWVGPNNIIASSLEQVTAVGSGAILGLRVHAFPGVRIGERSLIGTRCLLRNDIRPYKLVLGDPPRSVRSIDKIVSRDDADANPYEADSPEIQQAVEQQHAERFGCSVADDDWRREVWNLLDDCHSSPLSVHAENGTASDVHVLRNGSDSSVV